VQLSDGILSKIRSVRLKISTFCLAYFLTRDIPRCSSQDALPAYLVSIRRYACNAKPCVLFDDNRSDVPSECT